ncbi:hypothetical protein CHS0354_021830 [Potamilus streckersoni]|uniref:Uncharacterized protein n=1 Tax=Potamilus streckersoni TaxID=2493646 RepID=A0AAE0RLA1_9BIVA|nr:hypothetical protein CHS0354_021830 [Potamilus streckersoni]
MSVDISFVEEAPLQMENYGNLYTSDKELRRRSMYVQNQTQRLGHNHGKKLHQYQKRCSLDILHQKYYTLCD